MQSCYDKLLLKKLKKEDLCVSCSNYHGEPLKKKLQNEMGRRFQCEHPSMLASKYSIDSESSETSTDKEIPINTPRCHVAHLPILESNSSSDSQSSEASADEEIASPPRKSSRPSNTPSRNTMPSNTQPRFTSNEELMAAVELSITSGTA
jgi:hypothetical protein